MPDDFRLHVGVTRHPKIKRLVRVSGEGAFRLWIRLIKYCAENRTTGSLEGMTDEDIELAVDFDGEPGAFVEALLKCRLLDRSEAGTLSVHDWADNQPWLCGFEERSKRARVASQARWRATSEANAKFETKREATVAQLRTMK